MQMSERTCGSTAIRSRRTKGRARAIATAMRKTVTQSVVNSSPMTVMSSGIGGVISSLSVTGTTPRVTCLIVAAVAVKASVGRAREAKVRSVSAPFCVDLGIPVDAGVFFLTTLPVSTQLDSFATYIYIYICSHDKN